MLSHLLAVAAAALLLLMRLMPEGPGCGCTYCMYVMTTFVDIWTVSEEVRWRTLEGRLCCKGTATLLVFLLPILMSYMGKHGSVGQLPAILPRC